MAKSQVSEWSTTDTGNTDIAGYDISPGSLAKNLNNGIQNVMSQSKTKFDAIDALVAQGLSVPLPIGSGGTGGATADSALTNLGFTTIGKRLASTANALLAGTSSSDGYSFSGRTDTSIYSDATSTIKIKTDSTERVSINSIGAHILTMGQDVAGSRFEIRKQSSITSYSSTKAAAVIQAKDTTDEASGGVFSTGLLVDFEKDSDGQVTLGSPDSSQTVHGGLRSFATNNGDGSVPAFNGTTTLQDIGATGYNEAGGISLVVQNESSTNGVLVGAEILLRDSTDSGTTDFDTQMHVFTARMARYNAGSESCALFYCSIEGDQAPDALLKVNPNGYATSKTGFDLRDLTLTTGQAMQLPNNTSIAWENTSGVLIDAIDLTSLNDLVLTPAGGGASVEIRDGGGTKTIEASSSGVGFFNTTPFAQPTFAAATGTATRTTFATSTVTTAQLAQRVKALIDDLRSYGLLG